MSMGLAAAVGLVLLAGVLVFAVVRPRGLPEAVAAVPAAVLLCVTGVLPWAEAWDGVRQMLPTLVFLAGVLVLAHLAQVEGVFEAAGALMARRSGGRPVRLLGLVFGVAAVTTAVLSLDATVVLLTPVVFVTAAGLGVRPKPHVYATAHLANSASLLLPVSNLTNLLALGATGLGFAKFAALMVGPWVVAIGVEYLVFRRCFAADLSVRAVPRPRSADGDMPVFALGVLGLTLVGFVVSGPLGVEPFWVALAGAGVLAVRRVVADPRSAATMLREVGAASNPWFLAFVLGLAVTVQAVVAHGVGSALDRVVPDTDDLPALLMITLVAAVLANVVNNLPAALVMLPLVHGLGPVAVLAVLIGVNVGPNVTYVGSLATLLWRRIMADHDHDAELGEFTRLGLLTVPASLLLCTLALWANATLMGVS